MEKSLPTPTSAALQHKLDFLIELVLILVLSISPILFGSVDPFPILIIEIGVFLILLLWFLKCINQGFFEFVKLPLNKTSLLFLIFVLAQYLFIDFFISDFSLGAVYSQKIKTEILKLVSYITLFYIILNNFQERKKINRLMYALICIGFFLSFLGIVQKLSGAEKIFWISKVPYNSAAFSSFPNRNHFTSYIDMIIFLELGMVFSKFPVLRGDMQDFRKKEIVKGIAATFQKGIWLYMTALIVMVSGLFYSLSRGGIFSFVCGLLFFSVLILLKNLTRRGYVFLLIILALTSALLIWIDAPGQIIKRFNEIKVTKAPLAERIMGERKIYADKTVELIKGYPLLGVGFGAFSFIYNEKYSPKIKHGDSYYYLDHAHNDFLELFCEVGLVGFIILFITACLYILFMIKILPKRHDPYVIGIATGALAGLFTMCIHSFFDFNLHITSNAVLFFVTSGLAIVVATSHTAEKTEGMLLSKSAPFLIKSLYLKLLLSIIALTAFFYSAGIIIKPYRAYQISQRGNTNIADLKEAIRLDSMNDKYHFLLAKFFIEKARRDLQHYQRYIALAVIEVKEAIRLNPWEKYYPVYLKWIFKVFSPSIRRLS